MKFNFEDYKKYCSENNLKENLFTSLAQFKKTVETEKETKLIVRHLNKLLKLSQKSDMQILGGNR